MLKSESGTVLTNQKLRTTLEYQQDRKVSTKKLLHVFSFDLHVCRIFWRIFQLKWMWMRGRQVVIKAIKVLTWIIVMRWLCYGFSARLLREIIFFLALRLIRSIRNLRLGVVRNLEPINFTSSLRPSVRSTFSWRSLMDAMLDIVYTVLNPTKE